MTSSTLTDGFLFIEEIHTVRQYLQKKGYHRLYELPAREYIPCRLF